MSPVEWPPALLLSYSAVVGLVVGSFLNVVILRLPRKLYAEQSAVCSGDEGMLPANRWFGLDFLIHPPSTCPACGTAIKARDNIPVLGWLLLRGRCRECATPISLRYLVVEATTGLLTLLIVWQFGPEWHTLALCVLVWGLIALTVIDIDEQLLPDVLTLPLLWLGLLLNMGPFGLADLHDAVLGAVLGYLSLWLVFQVFRLLTGKEGMGYGDFKLFALLGAWMGWQMLPLILLLSSLVGAVVGIGLILLRGRDHQIPMPFGPYLATAGLIALLWGAQINQSYLQMAGLA